MAGLAALLDLLDLMPAWCLVPMVLSEVIGIWLLAYTIKKNIQFAKQGRDTRWIVRFGVALFLIFFGVILGLGAFAIIPQPYSGWWVVGILLLSAGGTFIYRALIASGEEKSEEKADEEEP